MSPPDKTNVAQVPPEGATNVVELKRGASALAPASSAVILGKLVGLSECGEPRVHFEENDAGEALPALSTVNLGATDVGRDVTVTFVNGDRRQPVVSGVLRSTASTARNNATTVTLDGERLVLSARREIVLQCGKASLVLRRDGKVEIRGADLLSRSSGGNRIKGSTVSLN